MAKSQNAGLLFELLKSFVTLAHTLNLSRAVRELDSTRQTVRRHINILEEIKGESLFELEDRQYRLSEAGRRALREAEDILARGESWLKGEAGHINGLFHVAQQIKEADWDFYLQQHPISAVWTGPSGLLKRGLKCWAEAEGQLEHEAFQLVRPYLMVFRRFEEDWVCTEVGSKSSYATWYGWAWERSAVGRSVPGLPGGSTHAKLLSQPFEDVRATHGLRYDHVHTQMSRGDGNMMHPISYKRLLMGCRYPDNSFVLASLVERTYDLQIFGVDDEKIQTMPADEVMDAADPALASN
ncbi:LysR family transcriptional regulator [Thalassobius sp. S69A]|uniref:LysR family transcriptional regulator n=1 Tax=unclassified Thalassovita TaxID=2619711 RepID=UPI000C107679|nr:LysR family transcriptional regulator [Paracoccaceae bacterium]MBT24930.1 LysR family transcriptional regulator [Paracoccaceae bacterium]